MPKVNITDTILRDDINQILGRIPGYTRELWMNQAIIRASQKLWDKYVRPIEIIIGLEAEYAPFNWQVTYENQFTLPGLDGEDNPIIIDGYDIQITKIIADYIQNHYNLSKNDIIITIKAIAWDDLIPALSRGDIDLIIASLILVFILSYVILTTR